MPPPDYAETLRADPQLMSARLLAAGFDGISGDESVVLAVMAISGLAAGDLAHELRMTERAVGQAIDTLTRNGYLEFRDNPDGHGQAAVRVSRRGLAALAVFREGVMAARWAAFPFRHGDIVIASPPKCGMTWMQMICALLVFLTPDLPAPLSELSPWLDGQMRACDELYAQLADQKHRRFIKSHMPLSEIPVNPEVTYIVVARHPLDSLISLYYQITRGESARTGPDETQRTRKRPTPREWLLWKINTEAPSPQLLHDSLPGVLRRVGAAWARRDEPNVLLVHYQDLSADLEGEMRRLAARLGISVPATTWPALAKAATFDQMRAAADRLQPLGPAVKDNTVFFRSGTSGSGRAILTSADLAHYHARAAQLAPPDLLSWLHREKDNDPAA